MHAPYRTAYIGPSSTLHLSTLAEAFFRLAHVVFATVLGHTMHCSQVKVHSSPCLQLRDELGSLRLKVQVHEQRILPNHYYDQFTDFMVNAVQEPRLAVS